MFVATTGAAGPDIAQLPQVVEQVLVLVMVEQLVKLPKTVRMESSSGLWTVVEIPVPQVVEELVDASKVFSLVFFSLRRSYKCSARRQHTRCGETHRPGDQARRDPSFVER